MARNMARSRRSPAGGYTFAAKEAFRDYVWHWIASRSHWREPGQHVLLMPSSECAEVEVALRAGFRQQDLHLVDVNPAIVASVRRRYPDVNTYGVTIERAHDRIAKSGIRLFGASIDLCCSASWGMARSFADCSAAGAWQSGARIAVNVLRGRETEETRTSIAVDKRIEHCSWFANLKRIWAKDSETRPNERDMWRLFVLAFGLPQHVAVPTSARSYVSSNGQSFLTAVFTVYRTHDLQRALVDRRASWSGVAVKALAANLALTNARTLFDRIGVSAEGDIPAWSADNAWARGLGIRRIGDHARNLLRQHAVNIGPEELSVLTGRAS